MEYSNKISANSVLKFYHQSKKVLNLESITPAILKRKLINVVLSKTLTKAQTNSIKNYFNASNSEDNLLKIVKKSTDDYKPIQYFLIGKTKTVTKPSLIEVTALILNYPDSKKDVSPSEKEKKTNNNNNNNGQAIEININNKNPFSYWIYIIVILAIVSISGFFFYVKSLENNKEVCGYWQQDRYITVPCKNSKSTNHPIITINTQEVNINTFRKINPTKLKEYAFSKNEPKLWYASNNNELDFFNEPGIHPVSGKILELAKQETIKTYYLSLHNNNPNTEKEEGFLTKNKVFKTQVFIKNNNTLDKYVSQYFIKNYKENDYYTCKGLVTYTYNKSTISNKLTVCNLSLTYSVMSNQTQIDTGIINVKGSGFTKQNAKQNAISKIQF